MNTCLIGTAVIVQRVVHVRGEIWLLPQPEAKVWRHPRDSARANRK